jgi:galactonate dehydratase
MHYNAGPFDLFTYITNPDVFKVQKGMISLMTGPGLGIDVNEELIRKEDAQYRAGQVNAWRNPICKYSFLLSSRKSDLCIFHSSLGRGPDGAIREW